MKYTLALVFTTLVFLSWCFWWNNNALEEIGLQEKSWDGFSIAVPSDWEEVAPENLPLPNEWELVYAVASQQERNGYINNLVILRWVEETTTSSTWIVRSSMSFLQQNIANFNLLDEANIIFPDESAGLVITFSGQYNVRTPKVTYIQTARNCGDQSYIATISVWEQLESYEQYEYILESFNCS